MSGPVVVVFDVLVLAAVAAALRAVLARVRQPPVMGEVLVGIVLGVTVLGPVSADLFPAGARDTLQLLGQIALAGYLFTVGAHFAPETVRQEGRAVAAVAAASFLLPLGAGVALAAALDPGDAPRGAFVLFVGTALAVTAFPVLARIVDDRGLRTTAAGRTAVAAAAGQELAVWPLLAVAVALAGGGDGDVTAVLAGGGAALAGAVLLARVVVPAVLTRTGTGWTGGAAVLAGLAAAAFATEAVGLHLVLGSFVYAAALPAAPREAGMGLLRTRGARAGGAVLLPLAFAVPLLGVDVLALDAAAVGTLAAVLVVAVAAKFGSATVAARAAGLGRTDARTVGVLMNARGLVELVVLAVGRDAGLIGDELFAVLVLVALTTTFSAGPLLTLVGRQRAVRRATPAVSRC